MRRFIEDFMGQHALKTVEYDDTPGGDDTLLPEQFWGGFIDLAR
jgi:hypothetical protein